MSETTETPKETGAAASTESSDSLANLASDEGADSWTGENEGGDNKDEDSSKKDEGNNDDSSESSDSDSTTESDSESETETGTETEEGKDGETSETETPADIAAVKELITKGEPVPESTDKNLVKAARAELLYEEAQAETAKLRSYLNQNPAELFTEEQKAELSEILDTGTDKEEAQEKWYKRRKEMEQEVIDSRLNNPEFKEKAKAVAEEDAYKKFRADNKVTHENLKAATLHSDVVAYNKGKNGEEGGITRDEFLKRCLANYKKLKGNIHKGDTPPKVVKGSSAKSSASKGDTWHGD